MGNLFKEVVLSVLVFEKKNLEIKSVHLFNLVMTRTTHYYNKIEQVYRFYLEILFFFSKTRLKHTL